MKLNLLKLISSFLPKAAPVARQLGAGNDFKAILKEAAPTPPPSESTSIGDVKTPPAVKPAVSFSARYSEQHVQADNKLSQDSKLGTKITGHAAAASGQQTPTKPTDAIQNSASPVISPVSALFETVTMQSKTAVSLNLSAVSSRRASDETKSEATKNRELRQPPEFANKGKRSPVQAVVSTHGAIATSVTPPYAEGHATSLPTTELTAEAPLNRSNGTTSPPSRPLPYRDPNASRDKELTSTEALLSNGASSGAAKAGLPRAISKQVSGTQKPESSPAAVGVSTQSGLRIMQASDRRPVNSVPRTRDEEPVKNRVQAGVNPEMPLRSAEAATPVNQRSDDAALPRETANPATRQGNTQSVTQPRAVEPSRHLGETVNSVKPVQPTVLLGRSRESAAVPNAVPNDVPQQTDTHFKDNNDYRPYLVQQRFELANTQNSMPSRRTTPGSSTVWQKPELTHSATDTRILEKCAETPRVATVQNTQTRAETLTEPVAVNSRLRQPAVSQMQAPTPDARRVVAKDSPDQIRASYDTPLKSISPRSDKLASFVASVDETQKKVTLEREYTAPSMIEEAARSEVAVKPDNSRAKPTQLSTPSQSVTRTEIGHVHADTRGTDTRHKAITDGKTPDGNPGIAGSGENARPQMDSHVSAVKHDRETSRVALPTHAQDRRSANVNLKLQPESQLPIAGKMTATPDQVADLPRAQMSETSDASPRGAASAKYEEPKAIEAKNIVSVKTQVGGHDNDSLPEAKSNRVETPGRDVGKAHVGTQNTGAIAKTSFSPAETPKSNAILAPRDKIRVEELPVAKAVAPDSKAKVNRGNRDLSNMVPREGAVASDGSISTHVPDQMKAGDFAQQSFTPHPETRLTPEPRLTLRTKMQQKLEASQKPQLAPQELPKSQIHPSEQAQPVQPTRKIGNEVKFVAYQDRQKSETVSHDLISTRQAEMLVKRPMRDLHKDAPIVRHQKSDEGRVVSDFGENGGREGVSKLAVEIGTERPLPSMPQVVPTGSQQVENVPVALTLKANALVSPRTETKVPTGTVTINPEKVSVQLSSVGSGRVDGERSGQPVTALKSPESPRKTSEMSAQSPQEPETAVAARGEVSQSKQAPEPHTPQSTLNTTSLKSFEATNEPALQRPEAHSRAQQTESMKAALQQALEMSRKRLVEPDELRLSLPFGELGMLDIDVARQSETYNIHIAAEPSVAAVLEESKVALLSWMREQGYAVERLDLSVRHDLQSQSSNLGERQTANGTGRQAQGARGSSGTQVNHDDSSSLSNVRPSHSGAHVWTA